jgi:hypothetical protein
MSALPAKADILKRLAAMRTMNKSGCVVLLPFKLARRVGPTAAEMYAMGQTRESQRRNHTSDSKPQWWNVWNVPTAKIASVVRPPSKETAN